MTYAIAESIGPFYVGDVPAPSVLSIDNEEGNDVALSAVTSVTASLNGVAIAATKSGDKITVTWPTPSTFSTPTINSLSLALITAAGTVSVLPAQFVVDGPQGGWHTLSSARASWADAPGDVQLFELLEVAKMQCVTYAPETLAVPVPTAYRLAQIMQARNIWNAARTDPSSGAIGEGEYAVTPRPMDWMVKNLLRPKRAVPVVA